MTRSPSVADDQDTESLTDALAAIRLQPAADERLPPSPLEHDEGAGHWRLGACARRREAIQAVNALRPWIVDPNRHSAGIHIVEQNVLQPRTRPLDTEPPDRGLPKTRQVRHARRA